MKNQIKNMFFLGCYMFYYLAAERIISDYARNMVGTENVAKLYGAGGIATAFGFLSFYFFRRWIKNFKYRFLLSVLFYLVNIVSLGTIFYLNSAFIFCMLTFCILFTSGYIGSSVFYCIAVDTADSNFLGKFFALVYSIIFALQTIIVLYISKYGVIGKNIEFILMFFSAMITIGIAFMSKEIFIDDNNLKKRFVFSQKNMHKYLWTTTMAIFIISGILGLNNGVVANLHLKDDINMTGFARFAYIPGLIIAGNIADYNDKRYLPFAALCAIIIQTVAIFILGTEGIFNIAIGIIYFCGGFMSIYSVVILTEIAVLTHEPDLWPGMGRAAKYAATGVATIWGEFAFKNLPVRAFAGVYIMLIVGFLMTLFWGGTLHDEILQDKPSIFEENMEKLFEVIASIYRLTLIEQEILKKLYLNKSNSEIASELFISESAVKFHVKNLLKKICLSDRKEVTSWVLEHGRVNYNRGLF